MDDENWIEMKAMVMVLQEDVAELKAKEHLEETFSEYDREDRLEILAKMIQELKDELMDIKDSMEKSEGTEKAQISQTAIPTMQPKGLNAPGGMSTEQLQEFKKQTLQINGLQQKMKDLEAKLTEATLAIKKGNERAAEMDEKSVENVKDLYSTIDQINNSLSEKIAQQRVEMQKIAGDTPKAINYDPFNYGEAYGGDFVDFQSRKRITEIKLLLQSLQAAMNTLRESVKVSPAIDLGYKVVRLDQLLAATGFQEAISKGEASHEDAVLITQQAAREPGRLEMPRKEMFQTSEDLESKWAITDSIMQTMYRLEMELGELQKMVGTSDVSSNTKILEDLQSSIRHLKEKQLDIKIVKRMVDENSLGLTNPKSRAPSVDVRLQSLGGREDLITRAILEEALKPLKQLQQSVNVVLKHFKDRISDTRSSAAAKRIKTSSYIPKSMLYDPNKSPNMQTFMKVPTRLRYILNRTYNIDTCNVTMDVYSVPRPCGAGYAVYWPVLEKSNKEMEPQPKLAPSPDTKSCYIQGVDGHYYLGSDIPVLESEYKKKVPITIVKANVILKNASEVRIESGKGVRQVHYQGKEAVIETSHPHKEGQKPVLRRSLIVQGEKKAPNSDTEVIIEEVPEKAEEVNLDEEGEVKPDEGVEAVAEDAAPETEYDNSGFFGEENVNDNACLDFILRNLFLNNNNNAHDRPQKFPSYQSSFTDIIELVGAANSRLPELDSIINTSKKDSDSGTQVANSKIVKCSWPQVPAKNLKMECADFKKSGSAHEYIETEQNCQIASNFSHVWKATAKIIKQQQHTNKHMSQQEMSCTSQKQQMSQSQTCPKAQKQMSQSQTCPKAQKQKILQQHTGPIAQKLLILQKHTSPIKQKKNSYHHIRTNHYQLPLMSAAEHQQERMCLQQNQSLSQHTIMKSTILRLKLKIEKEIQHRQRQQYYLQEKSEWNKELPQLNQKFWKEQHFEQKQLPWQQLSISPLSCPSDCERDLFQQQREEHLKLRSINHWLDYSDGDKESLIKSAQGKDTAFQQTQRSNHAQANTECNNTSKSFRHVHKEMDGINRTQELIDTCTMIANKTDRGKFERVLVISAEDITETPVGRNDTSSPGEVTGVINSKDEGSTVMENRMAAENSSNNSLTNKSSTNNIMESNEECANVYDHSLKAALCSELREMADRNSVSSNDSEAAEATSLNTTGSSESVELTRSLEKLTFHKGVACEAKKSTNDTIFSCKELGNKFFIKHKRKHLRDSSQKQNVTENTPCTSEMVKTFDCTINELRRHSQTKNSAQST